METDECLRTKFQSVSGFLCEVDPIIRRSVLAEHYAFCLMEKEAQEKEEKEIEKDKEKEDSVHLPVEEEKNQQFDMNIVVASSSSSTPPSLSSKHHQSQSLFSMSEPRILRTSIYEKFVTHFQQFHNEQDALGLVSLVLYPCFAPDIVRETNFWMRSALSAKIEIAGSRSSIGTEGVYEHYSQFFETFSDALLIYEKTTTKPLIARYGEHRTGSEKPITMVVTPFTYFLSILLPGSSTGSVSSTPSPRNRSKTPPQTLSASGSSDNRKRKRKQQTGPSQEPSSSDDSLLGAEYGVAEEKGKDKEDFPDDLLSICSTTTPSLSGCSTASNNGKPATSSSPYPSILPSNIADIAQPPFPVVSSKIDTLLSVASSLDPDYSELDSVVSTSNTSKSISIPPIEVSKAPPSVSSTRVINIELSGYNVLYFDDEKGQVIKEIDHIRLSHISDPTISLDRILKCVGFC
jgi:hypothetical protein